MKSFLSTQVSTNKVLTKPSSENESTSHCERSIWESFLFTCGAIKKRFIVLSAT